MFLLKIIVLYFLKQNVVILKLEIIKNNLVFFISKYILSVIKKVKQILNFYRKISKFNFNININNIFNIFFLKINSKKSSSLILSTEIHHNINLTYKNEISFLFRLSDYLAQPFNKSSIYKISLDYWCYGFVNEVLLLL